MNSLGAIAFAVAMIVLVVLVWRRRRTGGGPGPGAAGAFYDMLDADRRSALEVIAEQRTGYTDPEDRDGNLPDFDKQR